MTATKSEFLNKSVIIWVVILGFGICAFVNMKSRESATAEFILPNDFRGIAKLRFESQRGQVMRYHDGKVVFEIPSDGILEINGKDFRYAWHRVEARYSDGRVITEAIPELHSKEDSLVHIWEFGSPFGGNEASFFVGTDAEYKTYTDSANERYRPSQK